MTKKVSQLSVAEFLKLAEEKDANNVLKNENFGLIPVLQREGITKEAALPMNMGKAWNFYMNCLINNPSKMLHHFFIATEVNPENVPITRAHMKEIVDLYKEIETDLEK